MRIEINIQDGLPAGLRDALERQINLKLASRSADIESVRACLSQAPGEVPSYECGLAARTGGGAEQAVSMQGRQAHSCIADAVARLARALAREPHFTGRVWRAHDGAARSR